MARQPSKKVSSATKKFLKDLATDAQTLLDFIKNPEDAMGNRNIPAKEQLLIRNWLALEIAKKLVIAPSAFYVHW
jgi:hypothetical protein